MFARRANRRGGRLFARGSTSCGPKPGAVPVTGGVVVDREVGGPDPGELSDIGSSERENEKLEGVVGTEISCGGGN